MSSQEKKRREVTDHQREGRVLSVVVHGGREGFSLWWLMKGGKGSLCGGSWRQGRVLSVVAHGGREGFSLWWLMEGGKGSLCGGSWREGRVLSVVAHGGREGFSLWWLMEGGKGSLCGGSWRQGRVLSVVAHGGREGFSLWWLMEAGKGSLCGGSWREGRVLSVVAHGGREGFSLWWLMEGGKGSLCGGSWREGRVLSVVAHGGREGFSLWWLMEGGKGSLCGGSWREGRVLSVVAHGGREGFSLWWLMEGGKGSLCGGSWREGRVLSVVAHGGREGFSLWWLMEGGKGSLCGGSWREGRVLSVVAHGGREEFSLWWLMEGGKDSPYSGSWKESSLYGSLSSPVSTESLAYKDILPSGDSACCSKSFSVSLEIVKPQKEGVAKRHEVSYPCVHPWILSLAAADAPAHDTHLSPLTSVNHQRPSAVPLSTQTTLYKPWNMSKTKITLILPHKYKNFPKQVPSDAVTEEDDEPLAGFYGQPWSTWTDFTGNVTPSRDEYPEPDIRPEPDTTKLDIKDMYLYGLCPEAEPFYAVICEICDASVKPQGLKNHMELWHDVKPNEPLPPMESFGKGFNRRDYISKTCKVINSTNSTIKIKKPLQTKVDKSFINKEQLEQTLLLNKEKTVFVSKPDKCLLLPSSAEEKSPSAPIVSKISSPVSILQPIVALTPLPSTTEGVTVVPSKVNDKKTTTTQNPVHLHSKSSRHSSTLPTKKSSKPRRRHMPKEQKFNPDKQCGVWSEKSQKQCTRSLTCSHHSLSQQRFVTGRSKSFDQLLAEHKAAKKASLKQIDSSYIVNTQVTALKKKSNILPSVKVSQVIQSDSSALNQPVPVPVSSNNPILSKPPVFISVNLALSPTPNLELQNPDNSQEKHTTKTIPLAKFPPNSSLSSQPPDDYFTKRKPLFEGITWSNTHPRPLAVCTFSARKVGSLFSSSRSLAVVRKAMKTTVSAKFNWRATS
uniref:SCA7 domain-containing protein n=1 Tax=Timema genevievae TaxID=629358 RepID=A0A7R9PPT3_TIMGE|nr:unnamed protein product [Timema genevievae]